MTERPPSAGSLDGGTQWSRIHRLRTPPGDDPAARRTWEEAWDYLQATFRPAMLATVRRTLERIGPPAVQVEEAEDVVQSFLVACLEHGHLVRADREIGRFRTFVAVCLRRHTSKYVTYRRRKRRAPPTAPLPLDERLIEPPDAEEAALWEGAFEEEWVRCILDRALPRVAERSRPNEELLRVLIAEPGLGIDDLALRLGVEKRKVPLRLHRARKMLAEEFWTVVQQTVATQAELEQERARLTSVLSRHLEVKDAPSLFG